MIGIMRNAMRVFTKMPHGEIITAMEVVVPQEDFIATLTTTTGSSWGMDGGQQMIVLSALPSPQQLRQRQRQRQAARPIAPMEWHKGQPWFRATAISKR
jgi:hypothetical protein